MWMYKPICNNNDLWDASDILPPNKNHMSSFGIKYCNSHKARVRRIKRRKKR